MYSAFVHNHVQCICTNNSNHWTWLVSHTHVNEPGEFFKFIVFRTNFSAMKDL